MERLTIPGAAAATKPAETSKVSGSKIKEIPMKKVSRVFDIQKNNRIKNSFTEVPGTDMRACFNQSTWSPAMNMQQLSLGMSHLIMGDSLLRVMQNLRTSWITTATAFGGTSVGEFYRMVELMNPRKIVDIMVFIGTNNVSRAQTPRKLNGSRCW